MFPEFTRFVRGLDTELATSILSRYQTAASLSRRSANVLAKLSFAQNKRVGTLLATNLIAAAKTSIARHHDAPYRLQIKYACQDIATLRQRARDLEREIEQRLTRNRVMKLKLKEKALPPAQLRLVTPAAAKQMLDRYVAFVGQTSGREVEAR
jgi:hypothetical protein